jgi:3D (Asp-Asp-Asp) domain-containing protein
MEAMAFTLVSPKRRALVAVIATIVVAVSVYETRMLDSGRGAWLKMLGEGDEQPGPGAHLAFDATAYCKGQTTAAGVNVRRGIAAADPKLLPVGSVVTLATGDPEYDGVYTIMDTGPKIQGRVLDLYVWSCHEALKFGRRPIEDTVLRLGWDPRASSPSLIDRLFRRREVARRAAASRDEQKEEKEVPEAPVILTPADSHDGDGFEDMPLGAPEPMETVPDSAN